MISPLLGLKVEVDNVARTVDVLCNRAAFTALNDIYIASLEYEVVVDL